MLPPIFGQILMITFSIILCLFVLMLMVVFSLGICWMVKELKSKKGDTPNDVRKVWKRD